ncbi:MAG: DUF2061 domain-containing protein [Candidatus Thiothrix singaporensis]|uniref:DUF2061 domain-containing protein n=1 Tax=Candidatus Thiothrix singaporensis TaxID=2799669 RepID=A0A7L6ARR0_9GAMM|nr:MAG: DUF2061 domain-containing protein [Candidatus Thiothrix singaporensis]
MTKTFTFAVLHFSIAFTVAYILTGSVVVGGMMALIEPAINTVGFYFHEQAWKRFEARQTAAAAHIQHSHWLAG